jgi:NAD(P)-dependent dehydrogenase (short-subunit alcohol dehydrogenase family)
MTQPTKPILLLLGAGPHVGYQILQHFSNKGFGTIGVSRNPTEELKSICDLTISADFEDPLSIAAVFKEVNAKIGVPNVVIYNGTFNLWARSS